MADAKLISPYWLSYALDHYANVGLIEGIKISRRSPAVNHLLFADDCLIFMRINSAIVKSMKDVLNTYEHISGQTVNYHKSEMVLSRNAPALLLSEIHEVLGVTVVPKLTKYLSLPLHTNRKKSETFASIFDKFWNKIKGWQISKLSVGGHFRRKKGIHWVRQELLQQKKEDGGLGFRNWKCLNLAFLSKQAWRIQTQQYLLVSTIFKSKYFPTTNILDASLGYKPSHVWLAIFKSLTILWKGAQRCPQDGNLIWKYGNSTTFTINSAYDVAKAHGKDRTEKSDNTRLKSFWKTVWKLPLPRKIKIFVWKGYNGALPTGKQKLAHHLQGNMSCPICQFYLEDDAHIFCNCWWSKSLWDYLHIDGSKYFRSFTCFADLIYYCHQNFKVPELCKIILTLWFTWYNRNLAAHSRPTLDPRSAFYRILSLQADFTSSKQRHSAISNLLCLEWCRPPGQYLKINSDASWDPEATHAGIGVIARDGYGVVLSVKRSFISNMNSILDSEGAALQEAFLLAYDNRWTYVIFETDNWELVQCVKFKTQ
ncbi:hypothetical protein QQ045_033025 [Rhodiola kirilowii]